MQASPRAVALATSGRPCVLLHPVALAATALMLVNDHYWKQAHPGWWSGKLSDVAWLILLPLWLVAAAQLLKPKQSWVQSPRKLRATWAMCLAGTTFAFCTLQLWSAGAHALCLLLGALQWPFQIAAAAVSGGDWPPLRAVQNTADPTDLLALPALLLSHFAMRPQLLSASGEPHDTAVR